MLIVDSREPKLLKERLIKEANATVATLSVGDYETDYCITERKTLDDFSDSVIDGRLHSQRLRLLKTGKRPIIVVIGRELHGVVKQVPVRNLIASMAGLAAHGISVIRLDNEDEFVHFLLRLDVKEEENWEPKTEPLPYCSNTNLMHWMGVPGIGNTRAQTLANRYSFFDLPKLSRRQIADLPGFGYGLAKKIKEYEKNVKR